MANKNITDLPGGTFAAGHKFEMFNTAANQNQSVTIPAQTVQTQMTGLTAGISTQGNTLGTTGLVSNQLLLVGGTNITLSQSVNGNSATLTFIGAGQSLQTQMTGLTAGISTFGNTAGTTGLVSNQLILVGGTNITLSQSINGNSATLSIIAATQSVQTQMTGLTAGMSTQGNTAGTTGLVSNQLVIVGGTNISLSQSVNGNSATLTINGATAAGAAPTISFWENMDLDGTAGAVLGSQVITYDTVAFFPLRREGVFPGNMTPATVAMLFTLSGSTATMSQAFSSSLFIGIYTFNASTLSLLNSVVTTWGSGADNANLSTIRAGGRWLTIHSSLWSAAPAFSQGNYWIGTLIRSSSRSDQTAGFYGQGPWQFNSPLSGTIGISQVNATTVGYLPFFGRMSVSSASLPASIGSADLNKQVVLGSNIPLLRFNNLIASY